MQNNSGSSIINPVLPTPLGRASDPVNYVHNAISAAVVLVLTIGVVFFFFNLVIGAIKWISSGSDKQALESAKGKITHALIGLIILFSVFAIMQLIEKIFGISILDLDIGNLLI